MPSIRPAHPGDELLAQFARSLTERDLSPARARGYRHDLDRFRHWMEASRVPLPPDRIIAVDLIHYRQHLVGVERLKPTTINRKVQAIKQLFRWAREAGHVHVGCLAGLEDQLGSTNQAVEVVPAGLRQGLQRLSRPACLAV
jgi:site-specific recombinase XerD